jgi:TPR repeat protein
VGLCVSYDIKANLLSKESRLSSHIFSRVLNLPIYGGDCSPAAIALLAAGDTNGAIEEWRRVASLDSSRARCVLAFISIMGAPSVEPNLEEARRLSLSAVSGERGYANYLLGCIELKEKRLGNALPYLEESRKAGFIPATTLMASQLLRVKNAATETNRNAVTMLGSAVAKGHVPAKILLSRFYLSGRLGTYKRLVGAALLPQALVNYAFVARYRVFSMQSFHYFENFGRPLFG